MHLERVCSQRSQGTQFVCLALTLSHTNALPRPRFLLILFILFSMYFSSSIHFLPFNHSIYICIHLFIYYFIIYFIFYFHFYFFISFLSFHLFLAVVVENQKQNFSSPFMNIPFFILKIIRFFPLFWFIEFRFF